MLTWYQSGTRLVPMESATETTLPDPDEPPTQVASPACPDCRAVYAMRDLVFGHPCHGAGKDAN